MIISERIIKVLKERNMTQAEFAKQALEGFYSAMDYVFRDGFGTGNKTVEKVSKGLLSILFGDGK